MSYTTFAAIPGLVCSFKVTVITSSIILSAYWRLDPCLNFTEGKHDGKKIIVVGILSMSIFNFSIFPFSKI